MEYLGRLCQRSNHIVLPKVEKISSSSRLPAKLKIVSISQKIPVNYLKRTPEKLNNNNNVEYLLYPLKPQHFLEIKDTLVNSIEYGCREKGAHFIVTNEFGNPLTYLSDNYDNDKLYFEKHFRELSKAHKTYLLTGTHHCKETLFNLASLYHFEPKSKRNPILHAKKTSAASVGEKVVVPYTKKIKYYRTKYGIIAILICLDSFDPTIVLGLTRALYNPDNDAPKPDIIFVPSYSRSHDLSVKAARDLSFFLSTIVVLTNEYQFGGGVLDTVYMCGDVVNGCRTEINDNTMYFEIDKKEYEKKQSLAEKKGEFIRQILGVPEKPSDAFEF